MKLSAARGALSVLALCLATSACGGASERAETAPRVSQPPEGRLPEGVRPTSYRLSLTIIPEQKTFSGTAVIGIELDEPSTTIWMHGEGLNVTRSTRPTRRLVSRRPGTREPWTA